MKNIFLGLSIMVFLAACSNTDILSQLPDNRPNYKVVKTTNPLEVPPDLTQAPVDGTLFAPEPLGVKNADLLQHQHAHSPASQSKNSLANSLKRIHHYGDASWIEIDADPVTVFKNAKAFWVSSGLSLSRVSPRIGIMETRWLEADDRLPNSNAITRFVSGLLSPLQDSGERDKFRTRIDYDGKKTFVYLTHYRATEKEIKQGDLLSNDKDAKTFAWQASSRSPELEVEMLRRLNLYLNQQGNSNVAPDVATKVKEIPLHFSRLDDGTPTLAINGGFNQAWALLGIAIDRAGYTMSRQDRSRGIYHFAKITREETGIFVKKTVRNVDSYTVGLADQGQQQVAVVRTHNQKIPSPERARATLEAIAKEIRF